jgi:benzylsuccinate CoA-transferase BbsF subunit
MTETRLPLAGLRVVDFSLLAAGPAAAKMLADYGAEVICVESEIGITTAGGGRQQGPQGLSPINTSYFHNKYNPNKMSVTIDLGNERGRDVMKRLIAVSDVFVANRRPSVIAKLGLSYEELHAVNPKLVYLNMPTMGAGGPRSFYSGVSWGIQAMAGLNMISGFADRMPTSPSPYSHPDVSCNPLHAVVAIMAALRHRRRTSQGQMIELAQYESSICWTGPALLTYTVTGKLPERPENRHPAAAPHDVYRCNDEDGWCAISVFNDEQWAELARTIGRPELADDPRYATVLERKAHEADFRAIIEPWTSVRSRREVAETLQAAGVPCGPVNNFDELLHKDPQLLERRVWTEVEHPELGTALYEDWGFRLSQVNEDERPRFRAPLLGEHNDYVFQEIIGLTEDEVNDLLIEGVLR